MQEIVTIERGHMSFADDVVLRSNLSCPKITIVNEGKKIELLLDGDEISIKNFKEIFSPSWLKQQN